jgi:hypothetical protein
VTRIDLLRKASYSADEYNDTLKKLHGFLDTAEPRLVYFLTNLWRAQGKAITYKELREAILAGTISMEYLEEWQQDYNKFVVTTLLPSWEEAMKAATDELASKYRGWYYNPASSGVKSWTKAHAAEFVTNVTQTQHDALRAVVERAASYEDRNVDSLARTVRSMVGLTRQQAEANLNYYENLINNGVKEKKAQDLAMKYAARQNRARAFTIARQELGMAYNTGAHEGVKQAQADGYMKKVIKIGCCSDDERVCPTCGNLDGVAVGIDEEFNVPNRGNYRFTKLYPPYHVGCRCAVLYKEVE